MTRFCSAIVILFILLIGCKKEQSTTPSNPDFSVAKFYGVGANGKAVMAWEVDNSYTNFVDLYRNTGSENEELFLGRYNPSVVSAYADTTVVNNTAYRYTAVPVHDFKDGTEEKSTNRVTIEVTPRNYAALQSNQIKYSEHIQPLFTNGCAVSGCHGEDDDGHHLAKMLHGGSNLLLSSWDDVMNGTDNVGQVIPFRSSKSHMIQHVNSDTTVTPTALPTMPPGFSFPTELRDLLIKWIDAGAPFDDGSIAYSATPVRGWGYITNQGEDLTAVIDLDRNKIARYITTGVNNTATAPPQAPHNVAVDRQNKFYYVNLIGGSKLLKFNVADNTMAGELASGISSPAQVALSQFGDTAYVTNFEDTKTNISVIRTSTMTKIADIGDQTMLKPHGVSLTPDFAHVLVMNSFSDNITIIRTSDNAIIATVPVSGSVPPVPFGYLFRFEPYQAAITPDSKKAFITCRKSGEVRVLDIEQQKIVDSIKVGSTPLIPAITPDGKTVFVANRNSNSVSAINTATHAIAFTIDNVGVEPHGVAVSKDGQFLYVSCENLGVSDPPHHPTTGGKKVGFVKIIDIARRAVIASLEVGNFASGMAVTY